MIKYLLSTEICLWLIKEKPEAMREQLNAHQGQLAISTLTLTELVAEAERSAEPERNLAVVEGFVARLIVLDFDRAAAEHSGQMRAEQGYVMCSALLVAGHARSRGLILVVMTTGLEENWPGLRTVHWPTVKED